MVQWWGIEWDGYFPRISDSSALSAACMRARIRSSFSDLPFGLFLILNKDIGADHAKRMFSCHLSLF